MKGMPAYLVALGVLVAAGACVFSVVVGGASGGKQIAKLQDSVESLRKDVAELRTTVGELEAAVGKGAGAAPKQPDAVAGGGGPGRDAGPSVENVESPALPEGGNVNENPVDIVLEIAADRTITLDGRAVAKDDLEAELKRVLKANPAMQLVVKGDASVPMNEVQGVVDTAKRAGIYRLSLATAPAQ